MQNNTNSIKPLNAAMVNGYSIVTFQRPLKASDQYDLPIPINGSQAIVWAIGPLNQRSEVSFHTQYTKGNRFIDFGRQPIWNCPVPDGEMKMTGDDVSGSSANREGDRRQPQPQQQKQEINRRGSQSRPASNEGETEVARRPVPAPKPASTNGAWEIPPIQCYEPEDGVFYAQMGPTGGKHGYPAITGLCGSCSLDCNSLTLSLLLPPFCVLLAENHF